MNCRTFLRDGNVGKRNVGLRQPKILYGSVDGGSVGRTLVLPTDIPGSNSVVALFRFADGKS